MSAALESRLRRLLQHQGGWMPFDQFMAEALYAPGLGYYNSGRQTFGLDARSGSDFVTAPELSPLFGRCLARQVAQALEACGETTVWEFGAGSGALAQHLLDALLSDARWARLEYVIVDLSGSLRARQQERLRRFGPRVRWIDALPEQFSGVVIGNEVLDAMPVKLLRFDGSAWFERGVVAGSGSAAFDWSDRATSLRPPLITVDG